MEVLAVIVGIVFYTVNLFELHDCFLTYSCSCMINVGRLACFSYSLHYFAERKIFTSNIKLTKMI